jgi:hypothetical protein
MSFHMLFSKFVLMAVATHVRHAKIGCRQFAVTGPAGKPEMEGLSTQQMLHVFNSSLVGMVPALVLALTPGPAREDPGASVDPVLLEGFGSGALVQIAYCQYAVLKCQHELG